MSGSESFFLSGHDPVNIEIINPNGTVKLIEELGGEICPRLETIGHIRMRIDRESAKKLFESGSLNVVINEVGITC